MKKVILFLIFAAVSLLAQPVPLGVPLQQGNVHLFITQLTAEPIFAVPGAQPGTDYRQYFVIQVWDTADFPVEAFRVTINYTTQARKASTVQILSRYYTQEAIAAGVPSWGVFQLSSDAVINSVLVEELTPAASEQF